MEITYKITNEELFNSLVTDVDCSGLTGMGLDSKGRVIGFRGDIEIELEESSNIDASGEFGVNDYVEDFGFVLTYES